ncbi:hypothetical protein Glove_13g99 [Diversispora epigaea]|uniref:Ion transport domain-containing protein n=1 Tax=Diversispora epigaea TaxID=1348612 RepID=A0A397JME1_9GLOM|nr:hypothetical protein Glove_13g99 [Diversispora epigaea]
MSRFLRVIHEEKEKGYKIYQTPTIMEVLDFKWSAARLEAVFFWTNGRWDQWDSFTVNAMSVLGSVILVLIFQNMLIAFMNDVFDKANNRSRIAVYRYHAELNLADLVYNNDYDDVGDNNDDVDNQENLAYSKESRHTQNGGPSSTMAIFSLKVATSKLNKKSQRNRKPKNKLLMNVGYYKPNNEPLPEDLGLTINADDQLPMKKNSITWKMNLRQDLIL